MRRTPVFVGWETVELRDAYDRTEGFVRLRDVLMDPTKGDACYGVFVMRDGREVVHCQQCSKV